jgi:hypothetical protein
MAEHIRAFPTNIERVFAGSSGREFFKAMAELDIFCETQYIPLGPGNQDLEMVYMLNTSSKAKYDRKEHWEAQSLILDCNGEMLARNIPPVFPIDQKLAPKIRWEQETHVEEYIKGDTVLVFNHEDTVQIASKWNAAGQDTVSWNSKMTHKEAFIRILAEMNSPWHLPFSKPPNKERYVWIFRMTPPTITCPNGELLLVSALNRNLNSEIKKYYVDKYAFAWQFDRPKRVSASSASCVRDLFLQNLVSGDRTILVDSRFNRVLVDDPILGQIETLKRTPNVSLKRIATLVLQVSARELKEAIPELTDLFYMLEDTLADVLEEMESLWTFITKEEFPSRKAFAMRVSSYSLSHYMLLAYDGKIKTWRDVLPHIRPGQLVAWAKDVRGTSIRRELEKINKQREVNLSNDKEEKGSMVSNAQEPV